MSMEKKYFQNAFNTLKPACDAFITEPNDINTKHLKDALAAVPEHALEQLQPYILIPLEIHLQTNRYVPVQCYVCFVFFPFYEHI